MTDIAAFWAKIKAEPTNHLARSVFADWLDEQGDEWLGFALRWSGARGRYPLVTPHRRFANWAVVLRGQHKPAHPHQLPRLVYNVLTGAKAGQHFRYVSVESAFAALAGALAKLRAVVDPAGVGVR